jgi:hypothetical protein
MAHRVISHAGSDQVALGSKRILPRLDRRFFHFSVSMMPFCNVLEE